MKKTITLIAALLALCCMAQAEVTGVTLTGSLLDAGVENHTDQALLAVNVGYTDASGTVWRHQMKFTKSPKGLLPGEKQELHTWSRHQKFNTPGTPATIVSYDVTSAIFMSGELRGDERGDSTGGFVRNIQEDMPKLHIWKHDGPLAQLKKLPVIHDLMDWFTPAVAYAQGPMGTAYTWPPTYYNPPYYPSQWVWVCNNPVFGTTSNPCPTTYQSSPAQGVAALCIGGGYEIGIQIIVSDDDVGYPKFQNGSGTVANPYQLRNAGSCSDNATGVLQGWTYLNNCNNGNPAPPILYNDNTGNGQLCGLSISGWYPN